MLTVIGNTTVDLFVRGIEGLPEKAEDEFTNASFAWTHQRVVPSLGGNGANTAFVFASLGGHARLWSAAGDDALGGLVVAWLSRAGVDISGLEMRRDAGTSTTIVLSDLALRRHTYHYPGVSDIYGPDSLAHNPGVGQPGDWLLATGYTLLPRWRGQPVAQLIREAHESGISTALDIGPALTTPVNRDELRPVLPHLSVLLSNRLELEQATGLSMEEGAEWALSEGARAVVVKLGADGGMVFSRDAHGVRLPCFKVKATGTVGAGDSFNAGLLFALSRGASLEESARFANATAALVVSSARGVLDAPSEADVRALLSSGVQL